jgi:hypothetical protein
LKNPKFSKQGLASALDHNFAYKGKGLPDKIGHEGFKAPNFSENPLKKNHIRTLGSQHTQGHSFLHDDLNDLVIKDTRKKDYANSLRDQIQRDEEKKRHEKAVD